MSTSQDPASPENPPAAGLEEIRRAMERQNDRVAQHLEAQTHQSERLAQQLEAQNRTIVELLTRLSAPPPPTPEPPIQNE